MTALRQRMIEDLRIRNYSPRTIDTYVRCVAGFAKHFGESPDQLGPEHIREYQRFLVETKRASWSLFNQYVCALRFFYSVTLGRPWLVEHIPYPKQPKKLPVVLSAAELGIFFRAITNLKHRAILMTMYAAGLRISEVLKLQLQDIDSQRMLIRVQQGKGGRDRYTILPDTLLEVLREYWKSYKPQAWLFPGKSPHRPLDPTGVQRSAAQARQRAGLIKSVTTHTMRHCFATHLLETGIDLRTIQVLLGHRSMNTSAVYLHVAAGALRANQKPIDLLQLAKATATNS